MRLDRIIELKNLNAYPGSDTLDMVFYYPLHKTEKLHLWLKTESEKPLVRIDDESFLPQGSLKNKEDWIDLGITDKIKGNFGQLRVEGMTKEQAQDSYLLITEQIHLNISGSIDNVERMLWGLPRKYAGYTVITPSTVEVGKPTIFKVWYYAGDEGLPPGSRVRFAVPFAFSLPQNEDPNAEGYVSCTASSEFTVEIEKIDRSEESHEKIDIICFLEKGLASGEHITCTYNTEQTYLFSSTFYETDRMYWYTNLPPLSAAVAVDERKLFISLPASHGHRVEFVSGPAERLHLFLPGRRKQGKKLVVNGVFTDRFRNVPSSGSCDNDIELFLLGNGEIKSLGSAEEHFCDLYRFQMELPDLTPGIYRVEARHRKTGQVMAQSNPLEVIPSDSIENEIFWGEIHGHTEMSDGSGDYAYLYQHAREIGCLDFAAASDHACYFSDNQWEIMQDITNRFNDQGVFVTLNGYEWAGKQVHRNIYTSRDRLKLFRGKYEPTSNIDIVWEYFKNDEEVVGGPHGSIAHSIVWKHHEPSVERFIEMYSMWGANDFKDSPLAPVRIHNTSKTVNEILNEGAVLGFTGGGDCHEGHCGFSAEYVEKQGKIPHVFARFVTYRCGLTAASMPDLSRKQLIKAIRERHTYATTGARILLSFTIGNIEMGGIGKVKNVCIRARVSACDAIEKIQVIRNGKIVYVFETADMDLSLEWNDKNPDQGRNYYYIHVIQKDGQMAWSSPIWIEMD